MEDKIKKLKLENELLYKEVKKCKEIVQGGEKYWILIVRFIAFFIGFLPFIPNTLFFLGFNDEKTPIGTTEIFFTAIGFAMLWGSKQFSDWANEIGKKITGKY